MFHSPFPSILIIAAVLTAAVALPAWRRRPAPGARELTALALSVALWEFTSALCIGLEPLSLKILFAKVQYIAICGVPLSWFLFCAAYSRRAVWFRPRVFVLLSLLPALVVLLAATNEFHWLVWSSIEPVRDRWGTRAVYHHGPAFWLMAAYNYTLLLVGTTMLLRTVVRLPRAYASQSRFLVVGLLLPWLGNIAYLAGISPLAGLDPTPFGFSVSVIIMSWALARLALLDLVPVARDIVVDRMTDGVLVVDGLGRIVDANPRARRLAGVRQVIGSPVAVLGWPSLVERVGAQEEGSWTFRITHPRSATLEANLVTLRVGRDGPAGWLILLRDVSAQAEALRMREEVIALVSHELRTPLTAIAGALGLVTPQTPDLPAGAARMIQLAVRNTERLLRLTNDLLDLERLRTDHGELQLRPVPVDLLLHTVAEEMNPAAVMAEVSLDLEPCSASVLADSDRVVQVLVNLVGNAIKFSEPGGRIRIGAAVEPDAPEVCITVQDGGRGIGREDLERIFEPFEQVQSADRLTLNGAGLGLAISRAIVLRHGGRIWAESTVGEGSAFRFTLPLADSAEPAHRPLALPGGRRDSRGAELGMPAQ